MKDWCSVLHFLWNKSVLWPLGSETPPLWAELACKGVSGQLNTRLQSYWSIKPPADVRLGSLLVCLKCHWQSGSWVYIHMVIESASGLIDGNKDDVTYRGKHRFQNITCRAWQAAAIVYLLCRHLPLATCHLPSHSVKQRWVRLPGLTAQNIPCRAGQAAPILYLPRWHSTCPATLLLNKEELH